MKKIYVAIMMASFLGGSLYAMEEESAEVRNTKAKLIIAIKDRDANSVKQLLEQSANPEGKVIWINDIVYDANTNMSGPISLHNLLSYRSGTTYECQQECCDILRLLLDGGARMSTDWGVNLHNLFTWMRFDLIERLVERGANPNSIGRVTTCGFKNAGELLQDTGQRCELMTLLHRTVDYSSSYRSEAQLKLWNPFMAFLLKHGANIDVKMEERTGHNRTPLHVAVEGDNILAVKFLLEQGANPNALAIPCEAPIHIAKVPEIRELLVEHGADLYIPWSPSHFRPFLSRKRMKRKIKEAAAEAPASPTEPPSVRTRNLQAWNHFFCMQKLNRVVRLEQAAQAARASQE